MPVHPVAPSPPPPSPQNLIRLPLQMADIYLYSGVEMKVRFFCPRTRHSGPAKSQIRTSRPRVQQLRLLTYRVNKGLIYEIFSYF